MDKTGIIMSAILSCSVSTLGFWQIKRAKWKKELIDNRIMQLNQKPIDLLDLFNNDLQEIDLEYKPVKCTGSFDYLNECYVGPRSAPDDISDKTSKGYYVLTPFILDKDSSKILINRGWAPKNIIENNYDTIQPEINIINGLIRDGEGPRLGIDPNTSKITGYTNRSPKRPYMYVMDLETIANQSSIDLEPNTLPLLVEQIKDDQKVIHHNTYPIAKDKKSYLDFHITPMIHYTYAISWFSLATAIAYIGFSRFGRKGSSSRNIKKIFKKINIYYFKFFKEF